MLSPYQIMNARANMRNSNSAFRCRIGREVRANTRVRTIMSQWSNDQLGRWIRTHNPNKWEYRILPKPTRKKHVRQWVKWGHIAVSFYDDTFDF